MSQKKHYLRANEAMAQAKKNSIKRKQNTSKILFADCLDKISEMVDSGVTSVYVMMNEDQYRWGFDLAKKQLEELGYEVILEKENEDDEDEIPDLRISIEHLREKEL